ncbi:MAG TPA: F0F1 ATP synthase subunit delta [Candidatus Dormibacteraeota bacterium]|jgi:F-type H+-transporting ATPase subunit delta|nr:F0F1 ATP synthase subunit delta [Candidatus Dormibacteraeota bacterium]
MAASDVLARRYAEAYFDLARQAGRIDEMGDDLGRAVDMLQQPAVAEAMRNPRVPLHERVKLITDLTDGLGQPTRNLLRLLLERGRIGILGAVLDRYRLLADEATGVTRVQVTSAVPLDQRLEQTIRDTLGQKLGGRIHTSVRQDPSIIGGLIIRIGDRVIDGSLRTRLQQLRAALA